MAIAKVEIVLSIDVDGDVTDGQIHEAVANMGLGGTTIVIPNSKEHAVIDDVDKIWVKEIQVEPRWLN